jgi:uncharacterized protein
VAFDEQCFVRRQKRRCFILKLTYTNSLHSYNCSPLWKSLQVGERLSTLRSMRSLTANDVEAACLGGGVFACGGGGWLDHGLQNGHLAVTLGRPKLADISDIPQEGLIVTISAIGAPMSDDFEMWPKDYLTAFELVRDAAETMYRSPVVGVMNAQNGYSSSVNCWLPASAFDLPVVDAAGDIRAHPTIKLGAMGYADDAAFQTVQAVVGGKRNLGAYLEVVAKGSLFRTANILRSASVQAGGFIASARLPLPVKVVKERAALGAISWAINLGEAMQKAKPQGSKAVIKTIAKTTGGNMILEGEITGVSLRTEGGFDHAHYTLKTNEGEATLYLMNEFMAVDVGSKRLSTFPDTISVLSHETGLPLKSGEIKKGMSVAVLAVPYKKLPVSRGVLDKTCYPELEQTMGIALLKYLGNRGTKGQRTGRP